MVSLRPPRAPLFERRPEQPSVIQPPKLRRNSETDAGTKRKDKAVKSATKKK